MYQVVMIKDRYFCSIISFGNSVETGMLNNLK